MQRHAIYSRLDCVILIFCDQHWVDLFGPHFFLSILWLQGRMSNVGACGAAPVVDCQRRELCKSHKEHHHHPDTRLETDRTVAKFVVAVGAIVEIGSSVVAGRLPNDCTNSTRCYHHLQQEQQNEKQKQGQEQRAGRLHRRRTTHFSRFLRRDLCCWKLLLRVFMVWWSAATTPAAALQHPGKQAWKQQGRWTATLLKSSTSKTTRRSLFLGSRLIPVQQGAPSMETSGQCRSMATTRSPLLMMPEGPEVRAWVDQLQPTAKGCRLVDWKFVSGRYANNNKSPPTGWDQFRTTMTQWKETETKEDSQDSVVDIIVDWNCKGKFMYLVLDDGAGGALPPVKGTDKDERNNNNHDDDDWQRSIWITLGLTGKFVSQTVHDQQFSPTEQAKARWYLEVVDVNESIESANHSRRRRIYYYDTRNFGTVRFSTSRLELQTKLQSLGPDILGPRSVSFVEDNGSRRSIRHKSVEDNTNDNSQQQDPTKDTNTTTVTLLHQELLQVIQKLSPARQEKVNVCKFLMDQSKLVGVGKCLPEPFPFLDMRVVRSSWYWWCICLMLLSLLLLVCSGKVITFWPKPCIGLALIPMLSYRN